MLEATEPKGRFILNEASERPVILLAAGIGITPLMAMAQALAADDAARHPGPGLPRRRVPSPSRRSSMRSRAAPPNLRVAAVPSATEGRITAETLRNLLPIGDYEAYLCGPRGSWRR